MEDDSVGAAHLIGEHSGLFLNQFLASVVFQFGELAYDFDETIQNLPFRFTKGGLVGDLEQIAEGFGAFAVESADGEAELVDRFDDLIDLLAQNKAGKMKHGGSAHPGADVSRAGGEVAEGGGERKFEFVLESGIEFVSGFPCLEKVEAGAEGLEADMILLVDHHGEGFVPIDHQATSGVFRSVFATDKMFFHEELLIQRSECFHRDRYLRGTHRSEVSYGGLDGFEKFQAIGFFQPTRESEVFDVAGKANATGDHNSRISFRGGGGG